MSPGVLFAWKVSCFYEKVHDFANFWGCAAILKQPSCKKSVWTPKKAVMKKYAKSRRQNGCDGKLMAKTVTTILVLPSPSFTRIWLQIHMLLNFAISFTITAILAHHFGFTTAFWLIYATDKYG